MEQLSHNAKKLYEILKKSEYCVWESDCAIIMFQRPEYKGNEKEYWQWSANMYGKKEEIMQWGVFYPTVEKSYSKQISDAYQELRKAGKAGERNSGYNDYAFYAI